VPNGPELEKVGKALKNTDAASIVRNVDDFFMSLLLILEKLLT
jgi:hypothetical protein